MFWFVQECCQPVWSAQLEQRGAWSERVGFRFVGQTIFSGVVIDYISSTGLAVGPRGPHHSQPTAKVASRWKYSKPSHKGEIPLARQKQACRRDRQAATSETTARDPVDQTRAGFRLGIGCL